ncbi:MAG: hypothetical protein P8J52_00770 [Gammaproteobacteria bacterium]|nr:hypothetical protein [Gammaproteobacteria bacterium]
MPKVTIEFRAAAAAPEKNNFSLSAAAAFQKTKTRIQLILRFLLGIL